MWIIIKSNVSLDSKLLPITPIDCDTITQGEQITMNFGHFRSGFVLISPLSEIVLFKKRREEA